jgi:hypothetical protein
MASIAFILTVVSIVLMWVTTQAGVLPLPSDAGTAALFVSVTLAGNGLLGCTLALILLATTAAMEGQQLS